MERVEVLSHQDYTILIDYVKRYCTSLFKNKTFEDLLNLFERTLDVEQQEPETLKANLEKLGDQIRFKCDPFKSIPKKEDANSKED